MSVILGVDTGGTFTDFVLYREGTITTHKVLSTPAAPEAAILQGVRDLQLDQLAEGTAFYMVHGSTVATNAVLEGKGARTVFITNRGLGDMLSIGRQTRRELYNLQPHTLAPPVPRDHCLETGGRLAADGRVIEPLTGADLQQLREAIARLQPEAVAINLLFSYLDDRFEKQIEAALPQDLFISRASRVLPEYKEYERGMTTWLNACVGPRVEGYLQRLQQGVPQAQITVMQSSGGTIAARQAGEEAVHMLLSGPAGGLAAARYIGEQVGCRRLLTFDMGGTSTDVALVDGELKLTSEGHIRDYPVAVPMVDMHTIGAGGGSLASVDAGGLLQVGPESAGADPGPACYGQGGKRATVTDANLLLGRLRPGAFLGGDMVLDGAAAEAAVGEIARKLNLSPEEAAAGILRLANEHMAHALRVMSVQRGIDPRKLALVSFGGAGGLHVCALAEALNMQQAIVPVYAGVLSALGMLVAPRARQLSRTLSGLLQEWDTPTLEEAFGRLIEPGLEAMQQEGVAREAIAVQPSVDLRYRGQSYYLNIPWESIDQAAEAFHAQHEQRYGHRLALPVELVNLRVALQRPPQQIVLQAVSQGDPGEPYEHVELHGIDTPVPVYARAQLVGGQTLRGPALITETVSTTYLAPDWQARVHETGCLLLNRG
ncbi:hydantoinase/oxoprolinase family protein [Thiohalophilus thiocyanatoxydans]|uniref:N-methylhydantoinase A n=1 Tax=Thiohalophilus thiocyanatoxydans TaxID=381308 RepID=A0A4R8J2N4_9GAMM|nr:hydantoinase/oxoprolinase family protein [Thiohalophilus thiocyanatoxydans]TDY04123.1 N-methylhydantoinase A [Thiohalophilus thiocyanatoxydans]